MSQPSDSSSLLVMLGAGGHAKVLLSLANASDVPVMGVCDPELHRLGILEWRGLTVLGGDEVLDQLDHTRVGLINGIGQVVGSNLRQHVYESAVGKGFQFPPLVHPAAFVDESVVLSQGVQIMAGAVIQPDVTLGCNTIINTGASVDHDCNVAAHVHIAPGATLCGNVRIGSGAFVGAGSTVIQGLMLGEYSIVGAGTVMVRDLAANSILLGKAVRLRSVSDEKHREGNQ
ncbi:sugar O-acyltransferase, sialic acid O-acetyltransferase NeuD family [Pseudomonas cedrina]|uniref:Acetyltransferase n=2 Tax=Pseudomonas cedrina TaxID=651740 RepID=A0A1V2KG70_PSECE|nr:acetyltransferase [Pseudomonas cedrina]ONH56703.1 acetyltransferase [Pseudomonas cedrina subsp. cedrina]SDS15136.1 sugar O-acyltransferase, sialic acid O-acetyltransferase NeuD family [Pseudomonas cedrina]